MFPDVARPDIVREIRAMKARSESELRRRGLDEREVKRGRGGIRDIEFSVQLLQLVHGRTDPRVRTPTTLDALAVLAEGGYVSADDAEHLHDAYVWLRTVEHRLQLVDEQQTHTLPAADDVRTRLARVLGLRDRGGQSALQQFDERHRAQQALVREPPREALLRADPRHALGRGRAHARRPPRNGSARSASPTSRARATRCASSAPASPGTRA